jgi:hypothetical protein
VRSIFEHHPAASVIVVDNASTDTTALDTLRQLNATEPWAGQLQILRQASPYYEINAFALALSTVEGRLQPSLGPLAEGHEETVGSIEYVAFLQDSLSFNRPLPLTSLHDSPIVGLYMFSYPIFEKLNAAEAIRDWTHQQLRRMGFEPIVNVATSPNFMASAEAVKLLVEVGLFATHVDTKINAQGSERLVGSVFEQLGFSPWLHGLIPMHCSHENRYATKVSGPLYDGKF